MIEYQEAEREANRTEEAPESESGARATEEQSTKRTQQAVSKCTRASTSEGESSRKKTRKGSRLQHQYKSLR